MMSNLEACIQGEQISNLRCAEDIVLIAETPEDLQTLVDRFYKSIVTTTSSKTNIAKTEVQVISKESVIVVSM